KSGRTSPYFFNTGLFNTGYRLARLGHFYAETLKHTGAAFDMLYGPAYKGIPLVCAVAMAVSAENGQEIPFAFNRKEAKDHGEGGILVGAPLRGKVLIVDDVITAGTSVRESVEMIHQAGAEVAGVAITLDRQERGQGNRSAVQEVIDALKCPVHAIVSLDDIITYLETASRPEELNRIKGYREQFGIQAVCALE
ncbi:MAG: orotate phosphoribosyltransferase, partial [Methylococcaceae bacterium]